MIRALTIMASIAGMGCASIPAAGQADLKLNTQSALEAREVSGATMMPQNEPQSFPPTVNSNPDYCINKMAEFPTENNEARYQYFKLTQEMGANVTPDYRNALGKYGDGAIDDNTPLLELVEDIANPVLRQAAPEITVAYMTHVIDFASICAPFISGQIDSLTAFDSALNDVEFNGVITEDALFLRQILSDSMFRLGADQDPLYSASVAQYAASLVTTRDEVEYVSFEAELGELEALYMEDLDGRLKRSNDMINEEVDREVLGDSVALSDSMNEAAKKKAKEGQLRRLVQILGGGG